MKLPRNIENTTFEKQTAKPSPKFYYQNKTKPPKTKPRVAEGQALTEEDEEFLCNLCQRRFEEQGT